MGGSSPRLRDQDLSQNQSRTLIRRSLPGAPGVDADLPVPFQNGQGHTRPCPEPWLTQATQPTSPPLCFMLCLLFTRNNASLSGGHSFRV